MKTKSKSKNVAAVPKAVTINNEHYTVEPGKITTSVCDGSAVVVTAKEVKAILARAEALSKVSKGPNQTDSGSYGIYYDPTGTVNVGGRYFTLKDIKHILSLIS